MNGRGIGFGVFAAFAVLFGLTILFGSWYTVDQAERGVLLRNGAVIGMAQPGLGFKLPLVDSIEKISVQTHIAKFDKLASYSRDQQPAEIRLSVNYRVPADQVTEVYVTYGGLKGLEDRLLAPRVQEWLKNTFGQYNAVTAIQERGRLNADVREALSKSVQGPILIEGVQIENIDFSKEYEKSIEQRMLAEVEVQKLRQNAEREKVQAEIIVTQATARANSVRVEAQAAADAIRLKGEAEAFAIQARGKALGDNPHLVTLVQAERWNGVLPVTMLPGGGVPMITLGK